MYILSLTQVSNAWIMTSNITRPPNVHTFTYTTLTASDKWRQSSERFDVYKLSPILIVASQMAPIVRRPLYVHTCTYKTQLDRHDTHTFCHLHKALYRTHDVNLQTSSRYTNMVSLSPHIVCTLPLGPLPPDVIRPKTKLVHWRRLSPTTPPPPKKKLLLQQSAR